MGSVDVNNSVVTFVERLVPYSELDVIAQVLNDVFVVSKRSVMDLLVPVLVSDEVELSNCLPSLVLSDINT